MTINTTYYDSNVELLHEIINSIKEKIRMNEFYISHRTKNEEFRRRYGFTSKKHFKPILLNIEHNELQKIDDEDQPQNYGEGKIYVFIKRCKLSNIYGELEEVNLYIKIKVPNNNSHLPVISFHLCEY